MKTTYENQAKAVKQMAEWQNGDGGTDGKLASALFDAATTLNAVALIGDERILINERLRKVVDEFLLAGEMHPMEIKAYRDDFNKIINENSWINTEKQNQ